MIGRLALRSLTAHPVRSGVLAAGFGVGVGVMAILLGVAEIILVQARSPALVGGGDVLIHLSPHVPARLLLSGTLQSDALRTRIRHAAPWHSAPLFLAHGGRTTHVEARGGIPSLERALGDDETSGIAAWRDAPADVAWTQNTPADVLRHIDRFHPVPDASTWSSSWAEWLYFNGQARDARFHLTFIVGPVLEDGRRTADVRLQLDRNGRIETFRTRHRITEEEAQQAPELVLGGSYIRLNELQYKIHIDLTGRNGQRVVGDVTIEGSPGRLLPPFEIAGARGWRSGYVAPVMSGRLDGTLDVRGTRISLNGGTGYHDHNWGFWQGMSWRWGHVQQNGLSLIYGRMFPPPEAADPARMPGFVGAVGPDGLLGYATTVTITETNDDQGRPRTISVRGYGAALDVHLRFDVGSMSITPTNQLLPDAEGNFFQLWGQYTVTGRAGDRDINFTAAGAAETFRDGT